MGLASCVHTVQVQLVALTLSCTALTNRQQALQGLEKLAQSQSGAGLSCCTPIAHLDSTRPCERTMLPNSTRLVGGPVSTTSRNTLCCPAPHRQLGHTATQHQRLRVKAKNKFQDDLVDYVTGVLHSPSFESTHGVLQVAREMQRARAALMQLDQRCANGMDKESGCLAMEVTGSGKRCARSASVPGDSCWGSMQAACVLMPSI